MLAVSKTYGGLPLAQLNSVGPTEWTYEHCNLNDLGRRSHH